MVAYSGLMLVGVAAATFLVAKGLGAIGWRLLIAGVASEAIVGTWYYRSRGPRSGVSIQNMTTDADGNGRASATRVKWRGTATIPTKIGYIDLAGLGVLELAGDHLTVRGHGEMITDVRRSKIHRARRFGQRGIEIRSFDQPSYYFWTRNPEDLVAALKLAGFDVSDGEVRFSAR
jgi:hypothetical protein